MFIYLIVNHITGKYYVGQHKGKYLQRYLHSKFYEAEHNLGGRSHLYHSMRKHGREAFSIHALLSDVQTKAELDQYERNFIAFLRAQDPRYGYNICRGGEGFTGPHSAEARRKNSEASKRLWQRPEHRELFSSIMNGHSTSPETIEKIRVARASQDEVTRIAGIRKYAEENPEEMRTRMTREVHSMGGKAGSREDKQRAARISVQNGSIVKAQHVRWHINRGSISPNCKLCQS
jgi:hypothetical protein